MHEEAFAIGCLVAILSTAAACDRQRAGSRLATTPAATENRQATGRFSIEGQVMNASTGAPEPGVWVIAETSNLPTRFRKIVVTDDGGRFLLPELPGGDYAVWVRGYGLRDSSPVNASPGDRVVQRVVPAQDAREAAQVYPASYWLSLYEPPSKAERPPEFGSQAHWLADMKLGCIRCHQLGSRLFHSRTSEEAWERVWRERAVESRTADSLGRNGLKGTLANWASRIAAGEVPDAPPRPTGVERNVVVTEWEWGREDSYIHDVIATDRRNPTLYGYGKVWGVDFGQDLLWALDPGTNRISTYKVPTANVLTRTEAPAPGAIVYKNPANPHVPLMDENGKVWIAMQIRGERPEQSPAWARSVIVNVRSPGADVQQTEAVWNRGTHHRQLGYFDTRLETFVLIDTAFGTNHLQLDRDGRIWISGDSVALGMIDPRLLDRDHPTDTAARAQKAFVSIGRSDGYSSGGGGYGIAVNPVEGSVWRTNTYIGQTGAPDNGSIAGQNKIVMFDPEHNSFKEYPLPPPGRAPIGIDASTDGAIWFGTASGHLGRFDPRNERFTYWEPPGPKLRGAERDTGTADFFYSIFVDRFDASGFGKNAVILTGSNSDALVIFDPGTERFSIVRVPFPLTMYHRGVDGRIDDPSAGWKGRGLWLDYGNDPVKFVETRAGALVHVQVRPGPLAE